MKTSRYSDSQIMDILKQSEAGTPSLMLFVTKMVIEFSVEGAFNRDLRVLLFSLLPIPNHI